MASTSELKEYIDRKLMLGKLDTALLFFVSSLNLGFTLIYAYFGSKNAIVYFVFLTPIGLVMPVYVGYIRGALTRRSNIERLRGWLYLIGGIAAYILDLVMWGGQEGLFDVLWRMTGETRLLEVYLLSWVIPALFAFLYAFSYGFVALSPLPKLLKVSATKEPVSDVLQYTSAAGGLLAMALASMAQSFLGRIGPVYGAPEIMLMMSIGFMGFAVLEYLARRKSAAIDRSILEVREE